MEEHVQGLEKAMRANRVIPHVIEIASKD